MQRTDHPSPMSRDDQKGNSRVFPWIQLCLQIIQSQNIVTRTVDPVSNMENHEQGFSDRVIKAIFEAEDVVKWNEREREHTKPSPAH